MPKPRRSTADAFYDVFSDMPISEQVIALRICQELHRQAIKLARADARKTDSVASAAKDLQGSLLDDPATESGNGGSKLQ